MRDSRSGSSLGAAAAHEGLEEARRFVDLEAQVDDAVALRRAGAERLRLRRARAPRRRCVRRLSHASLSRASASVAELAAPAVDVAQAPERIAARQARRPRSVSPATPDSRPPRARSSRSNRVPGLGQIAPQPARVTGPRQGIAARRPARRSSPRRLHSMHTLATGRSGVRAEQQAHQHAQHLARLSTGQPWISASTCTCSEIGVEVASVSDPLRVRVDAAASSLDVRNVAQRLDAAAGRTGADRDQELRLARGSRGCARRRAPS